MSKKTKKEDLNVYHLVIEHFDRLNTEFNIVVVGARSVEDVVVNYLELGEDYDICDELTVYDGECGRYEGEEYTIGIGPTKEAAAMQYVEARLEMD